MANKDSIQDQIIKMHRQHPTMTVHKMMQDIGCTQERIAAAKRQFGLDIPSVAPVTLAPVRFLERHV